MASKDRPHSSTNWRSRHRQAAHNAAHEDSHSRPALKIPELPGLFRGEAELIDDPKQIAPVIDAIRAAKVFAFDTEFIGESSYRPQTCLLQLATHDALWLIDPIAGVDVTPFFELVVDPSLRTIVHAGEQDLEQVWRITGKIPANVFDAQIAAGFASMSYPASLAKLVQETTGVKLNKGFTFTDWTARPLSGSQLRYAADDVRYLLLVVKKLDEMLASRERTTWAQEECDERCKRLAFA
ncbi:MAG TPA: ribonuclease D, partial [Tepidisphaeraceae bacterium]|nr:ribonuclease D [Tepidisphaeraceae bacterium]